MQSYVTASLWLMMSAVVVGVVGMQTTSATSYRAEDGWWNEVLALPGWTGPLPSKLYSGYVNVSGPDTLPSSLTNATSMFMHYFLFEAEVPDAPTIVWWNGGPGATSAWGLFVENGPLMLNEESVLQHNNVSEAQLILNPYRWTKHANLIAFCNPPPVGFSYCEPAGPTGNGKACGTWNDTRVGITDAEAIRIVLTQQFPHLQATSLFFMGESYAGVYIGETVQWMLSNPARYEPVLSQLSGVALGDACLGGDVLCGGANGPYPTLLFFYGHGQVSTELWNWLLTQCTMSELNSRSQTATCHTAINKIYTAVGGYYAYNLVDQCTSDAFDATGSTAERAARRAKRQRLEEKPTDDGSTAITIPLENGYWCPGQIFFEYFDRSDVRAATFVPLNSTFFNADDGEGMSYVYNSRTVMPALTALIKNTQAHINGGRPVQVWAYDGDTDPSVNVFSTQAAWWAYSQNESYVKTLEWSSWVISGTVVGGYVVEWNNGTLKYVTARGSGHMVPEYKPATALALMRSFVRGASLPPYVPPSSTSSRERPGMPSMMRRHRRRG